MTERKIVKPPSDLLESRVEFVVPIPYILSVFTPTSESAIYMFEDMEFQENQNLPVQVEYSSGDRTCIVHIHTLSGLKVDEIAIGYSQQDGGIKREVVDPFGFEGGIVIGEPGGSNPDIVSVVGIWNAEPYQAVALYSKQYDLFE